jgi:hypothetical protein
MIAQHELLGIRAQLHLLVHPLGHRVAVVVSPLRLDTNDKEVSR